MNIALLLVLSSVCNSAVALAPHLSHGSAAKSAAVKISKPSDITKMTQSKSPKSLSRSKWGVDNSHPEEYWFDDRIHTLGNAGFWGAVHAAMAPMSTKLIDVLAYDGVDIRGKVSEYLKGLVSSQNAKVLDLCCGVGMSTRALRDAFPESVSVMGIDTSSEMVAMARFMSSHLEAFKRDLKFGFLQLQENSKASGTTMFQKGNAEDTKLPSKSFDLVTVMYAFHEAPHEGRSNILAEARRLLQPGGQLVVVDISADYKPSESMLAGEPYVLEYQESIHQQLGNAEGFMPPQHTHLVDNHVDMWVLQRAALA